MIILISAAMYKLWRCQSYDLLLELRSSQSMTVLSESQSTLTFRRTSFMSTSTSPPNLTLLHPTKEATLLIETDQQY